VAKAEPPRIWKIGDCQIPLEKKATQIVIRVCGSTLFASDSDVVSEKFKPVAAEIADALNKENGEIKVVGHTDNTRVDYRWKSNQELSVARANRVAALIKQGLKNPSRVTTEGKGPDVPVASNKTPEGRAKNRRVEIHVQLRQ
jgi:type VI secretion system protein ImpK